MTSSSNQKDPTLDDAAPVKLALEQSREVKAKVEECVGDITAVNGAVEARISEGATTLSAPKALAQGRKVESKVQEVAGDLQKVTETLAQGIEELKQLESDLAESRAALVDSEAALAASTEAEKRALEQALHDSTTGLPNRDLFDIRIEQAMSMAERHGWTLAVMFLDLDRFKRINDDHGHAAGDAVLREVASRLLEHVRGEDTVCRNGGDEFLYLLVDPQGDDNIERIVGRLIERISEPLPAAGNQLTVRASVGIAVYPRCARSADELIRSADAAMYRAKRRRSGFAFADAAATVPAGV